MVVVFTILGLAIASFGLHRLLTWAERRGWIFYRTRGKGGAGTIAMLELTAIFEPEIEHVVEQSYADRVISETRESGETTPLPQTDARASS